MKKLIYTLLTLSILFTIGCDDYKEEEYGEEIIGTWTLTAVCTFAEENCLGKCTDATEEWLDIKDGFSMTFYNFGQGGGGRLNYTSSEGAEIFSWYGAGPYTLTEKGESYTVNLSGNSITFNGVDDVCFQFTLTK